MVRAHLPGLVLFARQWNRGAAEDVVQEAFMKLHQAEEWPEEPLAWLFTVVRNASNNHFRSEKRRVARETDHKSQRPLFQPPVLESKTEENRELITELESLNAEYREIIVAKIWGGLTFEQIAEVTGSSKSNVHRKYKEALAILYKKLEES